MSVWLRVLAVLLAVGEPLGLAAEAARILPTLGDRGVVVSVALAVRVAVAAVCVAAGVALWNRRPHGVALARIALVLSAACQLASIVTRVLPTNLPPDRRALAAGAVVIYYGAWIFVLSRSRVRG